MAEAMDDVKRTITEQDVLVARLRGLQTYIDLNPECIRAAEQPTQTPGEAADTIEALTQRLAASYDNEIALTEENERLRSAAGEADAATGDLWIALRSVKRGDWDAMVESIKIAFKRLNEYVHLSDVAK